MNALLFERSVWFATGPLILEEEAHEMEDFSYHRPVLAQETVELLAPRAGSLDRSPGAVSKQSSPEARERSSSIMILGCRSTRNLRIMFSSSRTLPGQSWASSAWCRAWFMASGGI